MSMRLSIVMMGLCLFASMTIADAAGVYKWKDADGRVHYGDQPKDGAERIKTGPGNGEAAPPEDDSNSDAGKQKAKHLEDCGRKRDQLVTYQKASRIVETDSLGNQKEFSDDERQKLVAKTQQQITEGCADVPGPAAAAPK